MQSLVLFLPLVSALLCSVFALKPNNKIIQIIAAIILSVAALLSIYELIKFVSNPDYQAQIITLFRWFEISGFVLNWELRYDAISIIMSVVVTVVSAIVHFYSIGYMYDDDKQNRFICYLSLFTFFMLILVTANNLLQLFVGWEGVGLCSYLLIGFWYKKETANNAAIKAFLVNRVGDFAFILGLIIIYYVSGSIVFSEIFAFFANYDEILIDLIFVQIDAVDLIAMLLFIGCMGKSAQLGLHVWLPDAMEGPTPVSALIHAATMVTAGVYLVVRCSMIFELSEVTLTFMTLIGALTCIVAASIALVQNDIKRVIAYSTCSQLGYMFFACGVSAYSAAMFHLVTHAFFKALLFLSAGNIIVALHHEQNLKNMGGLAKKMKYTYFLVWVGSIAIAGIPPFAGFYSKDLILEFAFDSSGSFSNFAFIAGTLAAVMTSFYSWRLLYLTFHCDFNKKDKKNHKLTELSPFMTVPLVVLVIGSIFSGYIGLKVLDITNLDGFWRGAIFVSNPIVIDDLHHRIPPIIKYLPLFAAFIGIIVASSIYLQKNLDKAKALLNSFPKLYDFLLNKYYIDELYDFLIIQPYKKLSSYLWQAIDIKIIDGLLPRGIPRLTRSISTRLSALQSGYIYRYAYFLMLGLVIFSTWFFIKVIYF